MGLKMVQRIFQLIVLVDNLVTETIKRNRPRDPAEATSVQEHNGAAEQSS